jgi:hypothetical protein
VALAILGHDGSGFNVGRGPNALLGVPVDLDPHPRVLGIDQAEDMAAEAVHMAAGVGSNRLDALEINESPLNVGVG